MNGVTSETEKLLQRTNQLADDIQQKSEYALKWVVTEMERRYELFSQKGVRDIGSSWKHLLFLKSQRWL